MSQMSPDARDLIVQCCNGEQALLTVRCLIPQHAHFTHLQRHTNCSGTLLRVRPAVCRRITRIPTHCSDTLLRVRHALYLRIPHTSSLNEIAPPDFPRICSDGRVRGAHAVGGCQVWDHQARACLCRSQRSRNGRFCRQVQGECNPTLVQSYLALAALALTSCSHPCLQPAMWPAIESR